MTDDHPYDDQRRRWRPTRDIQHERGWTDPFRIGDQVLMPDGRLATVVYLAHDGRIAVETPWSAQWERFDPVDLTLVARGED